MNKKIKRVVYTILTILLIWSLLTLWVEFSGGEKILFVGNESAPKKVLIVYNPDPIYNLDEQICHQLAEGMSTNNFLVKIASVKSAQKDLTQYDCYVFCANTYNWAPDWLIKRYISNHPNLNGSNVVAITLGSGSTQRAKRKLEESIKLKGANLIYSVDYWLMKPNDENRMKEKNVNVATEMAKDLGINLSEIINKEK